MNLGISWPFTQRETACLFTQHRPARQRKRPSRRASSRKDHRPALNKQQIQRCSTAKEKILYCLRARSCIGRLRAMRQTDQICWQEVASKTEPSSGPRSAKGRSENMGTLGAHIRNFFCRGQVFRRARMMKRQATDLARNSRSVCTKTGCVHRS